MKIIRGKIVQKRPKRAARRHKGARRRVKRPIVSRLFEPIVMGSKRWFEEVERRRKTLSMNTKVPPKLSFVEMNALLDIYFPACTSYAQALLYSAIKRAILKRLPAEKMDATSFCNFIESSIGFAPKPQWELEVDPKMVELRDNYAILTLRQ